MSLDSDTLTIWEVHPEYPSTEIRKNRSGNVVLSLFPEGIIPSQCWCWVVEPAKKLPNKRGVNQGSDLNKEVARRQAEMAAIAYGYEFEVVDSNAPNPAHVSLLIRGRSLADAASLVQRMGLIFRIGSTDGRGAILTDDICKDRITVTVLAGVVTDAHPG